MKDDLGAYSKHSREQMKIQKYAHLTGYEGYLTNPLTTKFHEDCVTKSKYFKSSMAVGVRMCPQD